MLVLFYFRRDYLVVLVPVLPENSLGLLNIEEVVEELILGLVRGDLDVLDQRVDIGVHDCHDLLGPGLPRPIVIKLQESPVNKYLSLGADWLLITKPINSGGISYS